jgi:protease-4
MRRLWRIFVGSLAVLGGVAVLLALGGVVAAAKFSGHKESLPREIVLDLDLTASLKDEPPGEGISPFGGGHHHPKLRDLVEALLKGAEDSRVKGASLLLGGADMALPNAQEVRDALAAFRAKGKFVLAFSESMGEFGGGTIDAYLASAADEVWLQPSGDVGLTGFSAEMPFIRGALDKLDVEPRFERRHEFKSAVETFTGTGMSEPFRASMQALLDSWLGQVADGIAQGRKIDQAQVRRLIDTAPHSAQEAQEAKLVDRLGYRDEFDEAVDEKAKEAERVPPLAYLSGAGRLHAKGTKIAAIYATGPVVSGGGEEGPFADSQSMSSDKLSGAILDAADDDEVAAIVIRVDSPGGSYVASDTIWRAVGLAREKGKPVIASVGEMAASGGYFVAMAADRVVAEPGSIVGSIGVFAGKMVLEKLWPKIGIAWDGVKAGANAGALSPNRDFTPEAKAKLNRMLDRIYADFTAKAAQARNLDLQAVDKVARGRIFTGIEAQKAGLVDALGGFDAALDEARKAAKLDPKERLDVVLFPKPRSMLEKLAEILDSSALPLGLETASRLALRMRPWLESVEAAQSGPAASLRLPRIETR